MQGALKHSKARFRRPLVYEVHWIGNRGDEETDRQGIHELW